MGAFISSKMGGSGSSGGAPADSSEQQQQQTGGAAVVRPFPYVVPIVAKSGNLLFDEAGRCTKVRGQSCLGIVLLHTRSASSSSCRALGTRVAVLLWLCCCSCEQLPANGWNVLLLGWLQMWCESWRL
jgi:hypothetical protein